MNFERYIRVISARRWIVIGSIVVVTSVALLEGFLADGSSTYTAELSLLRSGTGLGASAEGQPAYIDPTDKFPFSLDIDWLVDQRYVSQTDIAQRVVDELGLDMSAETLAAKIRIAPVGEEGKLVSLSVSLEDKDTAQAIIKEYADQYTAATESAQKNLTDRALEYYELVAASTLEAIITLTGDVDLDEASIADPTALALVREYLSVQDSIGRVATLQESLDGALLPVGETSVREVAASSPIKYLPLAVVAGAILGLILAFARERMEDRVRVVEDIEDVTGDSPLAVLPVKGDGKSISGSQGGTIITPAASATTLLEILRSHDLSDIIAVTSVREDRYGVHMATELAEASLRLGEPVTILDCCKGTVADLVSGDMIRVVECGKDGVPALGSSNLGEYIRSLADDSSRIVVASPAAPGSSAAVSLAGFSNVVIVTVRAGVPSKSELNAVYESLKYIDHARIAIAWMPPMTGSASWKMGSYRTFGAGDDPLRDTASNG